MKIDLEKIPKDWLPIYKNDQIKKKAYLIYQQLDLTELYAKFNEKYNYLQEVLMSEEFEYGGGIPYKLAWEEIWYTLNGLRVVIYLMSEQDMEPRFSPDKWVIEIVSPHVNSSRKVDVTLIRKRNRNDEKQNSNNN